MTESSIPQQGTTLGDASAAPYSADAFALYMSKQIGFGGSRANLGIVRGNSASPVSNIAFYGLDVRATNPASASINLKSGTALVTGTLYENTADISLAVGANSSGNPRIDTVVLRKDYVAQTVRVVLKQGTPAASPVPPSLTQSAGSTWEIALADIAVANGFSTISQTDITPRGAFINEPDRIILDRVKNVSGGILVTGDVVVASPGTNPEQLEASTTTTENNPTVLGTWIGRTADGDYGRVLRQGFGLVNVGNTGLGTGCLVTYSVAKQAQSISPLTLGLNQLGWLASTGSATGLRLAYINPRPNESMAFYRAVDTKAQNTAGGTFTNGAWRTRTLNSALVTPQFNSPQLAANVITLPAGRFYVRASAPAYNVDAHQVRLNVNGGTIFRYGTTEYAPSGIQSRSFVEAYVQGGQTVSLEHICATTRATDGFGRAGNLAAEYYAVLEVYCLSLAVG